MQTKPKKGASLYAFLETTGILSNGGTDEDFRRLKKQYWSEYRRLWKKNKRNSSKSFEILFTTQEVKVITSQAKKQLISPTSYIKLSALSQKQNSISPVIKGEIRKLWLLHYTALQSMIEGNILPEDIGTELLEQLSAIETIVLKVFN